MVTVLQAVELARDCFLSEAILWLGVRRLPLAMYGIGIDELRFSGEIDLTASELNQQEISESECDLVGLPPNPAAVALNNDTYRHSVEFYDAVLKHDLGHEEYERLKTEREEAIKFARAQAEWQARYDEYTEYFKSALFVDLRDGKIQGVGIKINGRTIDELIVRVDENIAQLNRQSMEIIPKESWVLSKIDWDHNILFGTEFAYCWVNFSVDDLLSVYPLPTSLPGSLVKAVGDVFVLQEPGDSERASITKRGRPALPWDLFHLEVAALVTTNTLPKKKEAAIHHFEAWFRDTLGLHVGRSSIGQKLTPYYDRFIRASTKNGSG